MVCHSFAHSCRVCWDSFGRNGKAAILRLFGQISKRIALVVSLILFAVVTVFPQDTQVDSDLKFGLELFKNKMYDLAEEQFTKFLQQYPASSSVAQAKYYLAMSQFDQNKFANAATNFQTFAVQYPNDPLAPTAWMNAGDSYAKTDDYANAGLSYERLQVFYQKDVRAPGALIKAAKYFELSGDTSRAEISLLNVGQDYSTTPDYFSAALQLGNLYFNSGEILKAENQYKVILSSDNDSVRVMGLFALGKLNKMREISAQAEKYLEDAAQLNITPWSTDATFESIGLDIDMGNYSLALRRANQIDKADLTTDQKDKLEFEKVYASLAIGDSTVSKSISQKLELLPSGYKIKLASLLKVKRRYSDGIALLRNIPVKDATDESLNLYAELAFRAGKMHLADSLLSWYIDHSKNPTAKLVVKLLDVENHYLSNIPFAGNTGKNAEKARQTFNSYQNILKDIPDVYLYYKARFEDGDGNYEDALADYRELLATYPESNYAAEADSILNYISNFKDVNYKNAVAGLADIVSEQAIPSGSNGAALLQLGKLFENDLKDYDKAVKIYRQLSSVAAGDTERIAEYLLAGALIKAAGGNDEKDSESYSIYKKLASAPENDSIAENSLFHVVDMQCASGDSVEAENSALNFLKRFPNSGYAANIYCLLAKTLYNSGAYHEAIVQAALAGSLPEAQLALARSEIAIDSLSSAKSTLENFFDSEPPKKYLLNGQLLYINLLQKMNMDAEQTYLNFLATLVPSNYKDKVTEQFADYLFTTGRYDTAYSVYRTLGDGQLWYIIPPSVIYKMAYCKLKLGDENSAKDFFQQVVTSSQDPVQVSDSYNQLGKIYESFGDKRVSAAFFERAGSGDVAALLTAGEAYFKMGDYDAAVQVYKKILNESTADTLKTFSAARLIEIGYKNDRIESADEAASRFKKNYPGKDDEYLARFLVDKAEYFIKNKKYQEARKILDDVKSDYDDTSVYPTSLLDQARILVETGDIDKAQEKLRDLLKKFPTNAIAPAAHFELGNIYFVKEKYQDAIDNFRIICADSSSDRDLMRDAMSRLISSYESAGQYDGALDVARKFIAEYPDDQSIMDMKIKVGILYEELKYFDQALLTFQNLTKEASRDYQAELHYYVGAIYDDKDDYANAILEFLKVPYLTSPNAVVDWAAQAYYMAGKSYEQLNKPNEAIAMYEKIVDKPHTDATFVAGAEREINRVKALLK